MTNMFKGALIICTFLHVFNVVALQNQAQAQTPQANSMTQKQPQAQTTNVKSETKVQAEAQTSQTSSTAQKQSQAQTSQTSSTSQKQPQAQTSQTSSTTQKQPQTQTSQSSSTTQKQSQGQTSQTNSMTQKQPQPQTSQTNSMEQKQSQSQSPQISMPQKQTSQTNSTTQKQSQSQKPQTSSTVQNQTQSNSAAHEEKAAQVNFVIPKEVEEQKAQISSIQSQMQGSSHINSLSDMYKVLAMTKSQAYLNAHNAFRLKMGVPALQWDTKLETYAHNYASKCANDCSLKHSNGPYGENIFWEQYGESNPADIVKRFTDEQSNYDIQKGECKCHPVSSKCMCGHFTAVIWKSTKKVGCAEVRCIGERGILVVCSYDPPGNVIHQNPLHPDVKQ